MPPGDHLKVRPVTYSNDKIKLQESPSMLSTAASPQVLGVLFKRYTHAKWKMFTFSRDSRVDRHSRQSKTKRTWQQTAELSMQQYSSARSVPLTTLGPRRLQRKFEEAPATGRLPSPPGCDEQPPCYPYYDTLQFSPTAVSEGLPAQRKPGRGPPCIQTIRALPLRLSTQPFTICPSS